MKRYVGTPELSPDDIAGPVIVHSDDNSQQPLNPRYDLRNHSPTGFAWNYHGSGPAQLALALLADATGVDDLAEKLYQDFKNERIATLGRGGWEIKQDEILEWVETRDV